ncbi:hypothetical protein SAMN02745215_01366 [Desulfitobacterium chlororespirans DSM 11544]|uniref:Uncharacterized protein n=1 Tax=Desulfitobacterium chlororespirans DSM 11544 TaxID=1121395 RepID=A0A1M7SZZ9_9FIRM|nr:hypothetical protein SAMN02745215_01366 [Desulfitobacterium chlororespirans DSM 11544]
MKTKFYPVKIVALNSSSLLQSKNSTQKKALQMSLAVALPAALPEKLKVVTVVVDILPAHNGKCSQLLVHPAEKKLQFLFNLRVTNLYIAVIATPLVSATTGNL